MGFQGIVIIAGILVILLIGAMKGKVEWMLNLVMRSILGTIAMYFINDWFNTMGMIPGVGINPITVLTSGILGFPGLLALYGIGIYKFL